VGEGSDVDGFDQASHGRRQVEVKRQLGAGSWSIKHLKGVLTLEAKVDVAVKHVCPKRLR